MDWCRVGGPRGLCRPLDEKRGFPTNNPPFAPCYLEVSTPIPAKSRPQKLARGRADQSRAGRAGRAQQSRAGQGVGRGGICQLGTPNPPKARPKTAQILASYSCPAEKSFAGRRQCLYLNIYRQALPSLTVLTERSVSLERPCKWSAELSAV